jgi:hypothetical protein
MECFLKKKVKVKLCKSIEKKKTSAKSGTKGLQQLERHKDQAKRNFTLYLEDMLCWPSLPRQGCVRFVIEYSSLWDFGP